MLSTENIIVLLQGRSEQCSSGPARLVQERLVRMDAKVLLCADAEQVVACFLKQRADAQGTLTVLVVTGPDVVHPLAAARSIVHAVPQMRFLFAVVAERVPALQRESVFGAPAGNRWQIVDAGDEHLETQVLAGLAAAQQLERLRTTLDVRAVIATAPAAVDALEYRRLIASDRYLASVLETAQDAILSIDANGSVVSWNRGARQLFGFSEEEARMRHCAALFDDPAQFEAATRAAWQNGQASAILTAMRREKVRHLEANLDRLLDDRGAPSGLVVIVRDVSERERAQAALRETSRQKDEFLAMLSHELRNPLAPIRSAARLLQLIELADPRARKASAIIGRQVAHMTGLIDDLLDVTRVTRGMVTLDVCPLQMTSVVEEAVEQIADMIESRGQSLTLSRPGQAWESGGPAEVDGDRKRLTQVLVNLLANSAKFTPTGGAIEVELGTTEDTVVVTVSDTGAGIEADLLPHVFDLFTQGARSGERALGGLGIGLALVRTLTELHGGSVSAHSAGAGTGASMRVTLPRRRTPAAAPKATGPAPTPDSLNLVVVDDNADAAESLATLLRALGHRVERFTNPRLAWERLQQHLPQAAILDLGMPDMDGYELARRIRTLAGGDLPLLIALSGYGQASDRQQARAAGFDHHLVKPLDLDALHHALGDLDARTPAT